MFMDIIFIIEGKWLGTVELSWGESMDHLQVGINLWSFNIVDRFRCMGQCMFSENADSHYAAHT